MKNGIFIVIVLACIAALAITAVLTAKRLKKSGRKGPMANLYGEVTNIMIDKETGLTCVTVMGSDGKYSHGLSSLPPDQIAMLYSSKGHVQIPVVATVPPDDGSEN